MTGFQTATFCPYLLVATSVQGAASSLRETHMPARKANSRLTVTVDGGRAAAGCWPNAPGSARPFSMELQWDLHNEAQAR